VLYLTLISLALWLIGLLYSTVQLARRRARAGIFIVLIALVASALFCVSTSASALIMWHDFRLTLAIVAVGIGSSVIGVVMWLKERRAEEFRSDRSYGLLYAGLGLFMLVSTLILPTLPAQLNPPPPTRFVIASPTITRTLATSQTPLVTASFTALPSLTFTPTPLPSLTHTPTIAPLVVSPTRGIPTETRTPTASPCTVTARQNVNLRESPSLNATRLTTIPFNTVLAASAKSEDGNWWRVTFEGQTGWVSAEFVNADPRCSVIPTASP
jgi:uncharacterized membrane protein YidH (DUF202 family)